VYKLKPLVPQFFGTLRLEGRLDSEGGITAEGLKPDDVPEVSRGGRGTEPPPSRIAGYRSHPERRSREPGAPVHPPVDHGRQARHGPRRAGRDAGEAGEDGGAGEELDLVGDGHPSDGEPGGSPVFSGYQLLRC